MPAAPRLKCVYEPRAADDGTRVLVERLWPRGIRKEDPRIDGWLKKIAPSPALRTWYGHDPAKWPEFRRRYRAELAANEDAVAKLRALLAQGPATLVYAAKDEQRNSARVLVEWIGEDSN
jgi:uncharacterized protein YeaO (DUF488 family)